MVAKREQTHAELVEELERELELSLEMQEHHHQQWYAIAKGKLYRSPNVEEVERMLTADGLDPRAVGVHFMPHGPPYYV